MPKGKGKEKEHMHKMEGGHMMKDSEMKKMNGVGGKKMSVKMPPPSMPPKNKKMPVKKMPLPHKKGK